MKTYELSIKGKAYKINVKSFSLDTAELEVNGETIRVDVKSVGDDMAGRSRPLPSRSPATASAAGGTPAAATAARATSSSSGGSPVIAPIPGAIMEVFVKSGATIKKGQPVVKMEAMKMENIINAHQDGTVLEIKVSPGEAVSQGAELLTIG
jgi:glutaconyl-CoA/methylmalonyl-CoA decarboxylase subunit gamma